MIQQIEAFLKQKGYQKIATNLPEFTVFFCMEQNNCSVIFTVEDQAGLYITKEQYEHMKDRVYQLFEEKGYTNIHMLSFILSDDYEKVKAIAGDDKFCWMIDTLNRRLVIYENQVSDFYGIKKELEDWLDKEVPLENQEEVSVKEKISLKELLKKIKMRAYINESIIAINIIVFIVCTFTGNLLYNIGDLQGFSVVEEGEIYRLLTSVFIHADINHLVSNMLILYLVGDMVEKIVGHGKYLFLYFLSGLGGDLLSVYYQIIMHSEIGSVGASGAIFGIIGALFILVIVNKGRVQYVTFGKMVFLISYSLYSGFVSTNVDNAGHIGGLLAGVIGMAALLLIYKRKWRGNLQ